MERTNHRRRIASALGLGSVVVAAIVLVPRVSHGYIETTRHWWPMSPGACVRQESGFTHSSQDTSSIVLTASLFGYRWDCKTYDSSILIAGSVRYALLKKDNLSDSSVSYTYCRISDLSVSLTNPTASFTYASPPCGPGYYAVAMCMQNATAYQRDRFNNLRQIGYVSTCSDLTKYNISPRWHPLFTTSLQIGPPVVWPWP